MQFVFRNVNDAFSGLVSRIHNDDQVAVVNSGSRAGDIARFSEPVLIEYTHPKERVLLNQERDANPFFHLYEALWMLAGRNDVAPLAYYNSRMKTFSDDGTTLNGAYGYRWRNPFNQLAWIVDHLKSKPDSRRAVLQMWNAENDLLGIDISRDVCCNTHVYFAIRDNRLNMTVCNRSNDMIWGLLGANYVHFSFLLEYMANKIGVEVGSYFHFTNDLHIYLNNWKPEEWLAGPHVENRAIAYYLYPLDAHEEEFDAECRHLVSQFCGLTSPPFDRHYKNKFLKEVVFHMLLAFYWHKQRDYSKALSAVENVGQSDWGVAGRSWLRKRQRTYEE